MSTDRADRGAEPGSIAVADPEQAATALQHVLGTGDLSRLSGEQKVALYLDLCGSLGLNPRTRPFDFVEFYDPETRGKKLTLYPNKSCAEQLRRQHQISVRIVSEDIVGKLFKVVAEGRKANGVVDTATAYVPLTDKDGQPLVGQRLANAFMKGQTVAKRRLTFSMVGMFAPPDLDELRRARVVTVDGSGQIVEHPTTEQRALAERPDMAAAIGEPTFESTGAVARSPLAGASGQQVRPEEISTPPRQAGPRASFRPSEADVKRRLGAWFGAVKDSSLDDDVARHRFVEQWTATEGWPEAKQTSSLRTFFSRASDDDAAQLLAHVRALVTDERRANAEALAELREPVSPAGHPRGIGDPGRRVGSAVLLTGGPPMPDDDAATGEPF
jgi:hypothetical protein